MKHITSRLLALLATTAALSAQNLLIDFNQAVAASTTETGYQSFASGDKAATVAAQDFTAFGVTVTVKPEWPGFETIRAVRRFVNRASGKWQGTKLALMRDFIGSDTRSPGGGDYALLPDGTIPTPGDPTPKPTPLEIQLTGVPAGAYKWRSFHHDVEQIHTAFAVSFSLDSGATFTPVPGRFPDPGLIAFRGTASDTTTTPQIPTESQVTGVPPNSNPNDLISTVSFALTIPPGGSPLWVRFTPLTTAGLHGRIFVMNGFELAANADADNDGLPDDYEALNGITNPATDEEPDGLTNLQEFQLGTMPNDADSDDDGYNDGPETNTAVYVSATNTGTNPLLADTDRDGLMDGAENPLTPNTGSSPVDADSDNDVFSDKAEIDASSNPQLATSFPTREGGLFLDFSVGPVEAATFFHDPTYLPFVAKAGDLMDFTAPRSYRAFNAAINLTVSFPTDDPASETTTFASALNRTDGQANLYVGTNVLLARDGIGLDTRPAAGGVQEVTVAGAARSAAQIRLSFSGIPAGTYNLRSFHHDLRNSVVTLNTNIADASPTSRDLTEIKTTARENINNGPLGVNPRADQGLDTLASTINTTFTSNGTAPVVITYTADAGSGETSAFFNINGIEITPAVAPPPPDASFVITSVTRNATTGAITLTWPSKANATYTVYGLETLQEALTAEREIGSNLPSGGTTTSYIDATSFSGKTRYFYRVKETPAP